jgi:hypothetical protein
MGMTDIIPAMRAFEVLGIFNVRATNRMSSTLKYLKTNGLILTNRFEGAKSPARLVGLIQHALTEKPDLKEVFVYTDGSTNPKSRGANSGCSVSGDWSTA